MSGSAVRLPGNKIRLPRLAFSGLTKLMRGSLFAACAIPASLVAVAY
jgi:hypothetical protein